jgi:hypothetical protein
MQFLTDGRFMGLLQGTSHSMCLWCYWQQLPVPSVLFGACLCKGCSPRSPCLPAAHVWLCGWPAVSLAHAVMWCCTDVQFMPDRLVEEERCCNQVTAAMRTDGRVTNAHVINPAEAGAISWLGCVDTGIAFGLQQAQYQSEATGRSQ